mgnify:CR=1 FL=1
MSHIFDICDRLKQIDSLLESCEDHLEDPELQEAIADLFSQKDELDREFSQKIDNYLALIKSLETFAETRKKEAERLRNLANSDIKKAKFLRENLQAALEERNVSTLKTNRFNLSLSLNGGKQPLWLDENIDMNQLPSQYRITSYHFDKEAIREDLENGVELDFAKILERKRSLRIR